MKISIVISSYNRGNLLDLTLPTLYNQNISKEDYEIIIVNDRSTDNTVEIFNKHKLNCDMKMILIKDYPKVAVKQELSNLVPTRGEHGGTDNNYRNCAVPKNVGWEHAESDIIMFTDPEVFHLTDTINDHLYLQTAPGPDYKYRHSVLAGFCYGHNEQPGRTIEKAFFDEFLKDSNKSKERARDLAVKYKLRIILEGFPFNIAVRKKALEEINGWNEVFLYWGYEDNDVMNRLAFTGNVPMSYQNITNGTKGDTFYPRWVHLWHPTSRINNLKYNGLLVEKNIELYRKTKEMKYITAERIHLNEDSVCVCN